MQLNKLLNNNNTFNDVKNILSCDPYNLIIKQDPNFPNLYMLVYNTQKSDLSNKIVRECKGIILEKNTNKILCYTFDEDYQINIENPDLSQYFNPDELNDLYIEEAIDGTQIKLFYYNDNWNCSTTKCIDAKKAYWYSNKSFYDLFQNTNLDFDKLNKKYCYSFILRHPENQIVVHYNVPSIIHVLTRNMETLEEVNEDIGIMKPQSNKLINYEKILKAIKEYKTNRSEGYIIYNKNGKRCKLQYEWYKKLKELRGNTYNLFYRYLELRKENKISEYNRWFPHYRHDLLSYQNDLVSFVKVIQKVYIDKHIKKLDHPIPRHLAPFIYNLHGEYLNTKEKRTIKNIFIALDKLEPSQICYMYNKTVF